MTAPLIEGEDFYYERGFMVFTAAFLLRRGYCCESGCRHCPWDFRNQRRSDVPNGDPDPGNGPDEELSTR